MRNMWYTLDMQRLIATIILLLSSTTTVSCATSRPLVRDAAVGALIGAVVGTAVSAAEGSYVPMVYPVYLNYPYYGQGYTVRYPICPLVPPTPVRDQFGNIVWVYPSTDPRCRYNFIWYQQFRHTHR